MNPEDMTLAEMADYLANLSTILEAQEDLGVNRSQLVGWEYHQVWTVFKAKLKEKYDEAARQSRQERTGREEG